VHGSVAEEIGKVHPSRRRLLIYVNDLPLASNLSIKLFADDTVLSMSNSCINKFMSNINNELTKIDYWMRINKLSITILRPNY